MRVGHGSGTRITRRFGPFNYDTVYVMNQILCYPWVISMLVRAHDQVDHVHKSRSKSLKRNNDAHN